MVVFSETRRWLMQLLSLLKARVGCGRIFVPVIPRAATGLPDSADSCPYREISERQIDQRVDLNARVRGRDYPMYTASEICNDNQEY
jgi:hypothetical protein